MADYELCSRVSAQVSWSTCWCAVSVRENSEPCGILNQTRLLYSCEGVCRLLPLFRSSSVKSLLQVRASVRCAETGEEKPLGAIQCECVCVCVCTCVCAYVRVWEASMHTCTHTHTHTHTPLTMTTVTFQWMTCSTLLLKT